MKYCFLMFERAKEVCSAVGAEGVGRRRGGGGRRRGGRIASSKVFLSPVFTPSS